MQVKNPIDFKSRVEVNHLIQNLPKDRHSRERVLMDVWERNRPPAYSRFTSSMVNQPVTWWIGVLHLAMRAGAFGDKYQAESEVRSSQIGQVLGRFTTYENIRRLVRFYVKYKKADVTGRLAGGYFTNYTISGGRKNWTKKVSSNNYKRMATSGSLALGNFLLASYGAVIQVYLKGHKTIEDFSSAILTGKPAPIITKVNADFTQEEVDEIQLLAHLCKQQLDFCRVINMDNYRRAIPISEFCEDSDNIAVCKHL